MIACSMTLALQPPRGLRFLYQTLAGQAGKSNKKSNAGITNRPKHRLIEVSVRFPRPENTCAGYMCRVGALLCCRQNRN